MLALIPVNAYEHIPCAGRWACGWELCNPDLSPTRPVLPLVPMSEQAGVQAGWGRGTGAVADFCQWASVSYLLLTGGATQSPLVLLTL